MEYADAMLPCRFRWQIANPFLHWPRFRATFYIGSPSPQQWRVRLTPELKTVNTWEISFSLEYVQSDRILDGSFFADRLQINVFLNERRSISIDEPNYLFSVQNHHRYSFVDFMFVYPSTKAQLLTIQVEIDFRGQNFGPRPTYGLSVTPADLEHLSRNMGRLYMDALFSDIIIQSINPTFTCAAHYCILAVRWENLLAKNRLNPLPDATVRTEISPSTLSSILYYMYSGEVGENWLGWEDLPSRAELFQVIDEYRIYHLYKVFVRRDWGQVRKTLKNMTGYAKSFPLSQPLPRHNFSWQVGQNSPHRLMFRIQLMMVAAVPWFLYDMSLISASSCHVKVNIKLVKEELLFEEHKKTRTSWDVHQRVYRIDQGPRVNSGSCNYQGRDVPLNEVKRGRYRDPKKEVRFSVICILNVSDGTESEIIESEGDIRRQTNEDRFNVLSDHLYQLQRQSMGTDFRVVCSDGPMHYLHQAIVAARVPRWSRVFRFNEGDPEPIAETEVRDEAFHHVVSYMYTGKTFVIPDTFFEEINQFAVTGGFASLEQLISDHRRTPRV